MKTILLSLLLSVTTLLTSSTALFAQNSGDEAAIRKVLTESGAAFDKRDLTGFASYFMKSPNLYYQVSTADGQLIVAHGWEAMTHMVGAHMKNDANDFKGEHGASDFKVHTAGTMAWVTATSHWDLPGGKSNGSDLLILEKQSGQWKIIALTTQTYADGKLVVVK